MANTSAIRQYAAHITYQNHLLAAQQEPYKKDLTLNEMFENFLQKTSGEWTSSRKITRQKEQQD